MSTAGSSLKYTVLTLCITLMYKSCVFPFRIVYLSTLGISSYGFTTTISVYVGHCEFDLTLENEIERVGENSLS
jgi:hypothetical protein